MIKTKKYGDDHKLYGYVDYKYVCNSFNYLMDTIAYPLEKCQEEYPDEYECFCVSPYVDKIFGKEIRLTASKFKTFSSLYLKDLKAIKYSEEKLKHVKEYFDILNSVDDDKILEWG